MINVANKTRFCYTHIWFTILKLTSWDVVDNIRLYATGGMGVRILGHGRSYVRGQIEDDCCC